MKLNRKKARILAVGVILLAIAVGVAVVVAITSAGDDHGGTPMVGPSNEPVATAYVAIDVQDYGTITAELYGEAAPISVANFLKLVDQQFYDGITFHRIMSGFMIQGGDPTGTGQGGSSESIKGEFAQNGIANPIRHERGVLSMARLSNDFNSATSQFFIMHQTNRGLDGGYAAFGKVISGIEVVDAICENTPVVGTNGAVPAEYQPVITTIRRIEKP